MKTKDAKATISRLCMFICSMAITNLPGTVSAQNSNKEFQNDLAMISASARNKDEKELEKIGDSLHGKWRMKDPSHHAELMLQLCQELASGQYSKTKKHVLLRKYALAGLGNQENIPVEHLLRLAEYIGADLAAQSKLASGQWAEIRRGDATIRLQVWKRLKNSIDPNWNPKDKPALNVVPPGTSSPALRAQYQAAIDANEKKAAKYNQQYTLRKRQRGFLKRTEDYLVESYSRPPSRTNELEALLNKYAPDEHEAISRILKSIRETR